MTLAAFKKIKINYSMWERVRQSIPRLNAFYLNDSDNQISQLFLSFLILMQLD